MKRHLTGVWVGQRKIASIGVAARHWVTFHGLALSVERGENIAGRLQPCGFSAETMTSMADILGRSVESSAVRHELLLQLSRRLARLSP